MMPWTEKFSGMSEFWFGRVAPSGVCQNLPRGLLLKGGESEPAKLANTAYFASRTRCEASTKVRSKGVVLRPVADQDIEEAIAHDLGEDAAEAALGFIGELEKAYSHISRQPGSGSPRYAHELNLPGLRFWPLGHFPCLIFYFEHADAVDVWRVLYAQRDIPAWMSEPGQAPQNKRSNATSHTSPSKR